MSKVVYYNLPGAIFFITILFWRGGGVVNLPSALKLFTLLHSGSDPACFQYDWCCQIRTQDRWLWGLQGKLLHHSFTSIFFIVSFKKQHTFDCSHDHKLAEP